MRNLAAHPDFQLTERKYKQGASSREAITLASWYHNGLLSTLGDGEAGNAAEELRRELSGGAESDLVEFIADEERVMRAQAKRKLRKAA